MKTSPFLRVSLPFLKYGLAFGLVAWLISSGKVDVTKVGAAFEHPWLLFLSFFFQGAAIAVTIVRWHYLLRMQDFKLPFAETLRYAMIGHFFSNFGLGVLSGDVVKTCYVAGKVKNKAAAVVTVTLDRAVGLFAMMAVAYIGLLFYWQRVSTNPQMESIAGAISVFLWVTAAAFALGLSAKVKNHPAMRLLMGELPFARIFNDLYDAFHELRNHPRFSLAIIGMSLSVPLLNVCAFYFMGGAFEGTHITLPDYCLIVPLLLVVTALPISPGGIGVGQVAALAVFKMIAGVETSVGADMVTVMQLFAIIIALAGAWIFVRNRAELSAMEKRVGLEPIS